MAVNKTVYPELNALLTVVAALWVLSLSCPACAEETPKSGAKVARTVPKDVYPESGFRLPLPKRDDFDEEGKKIFDKRAGTSARSLRGLQGPSGIRLYSPKLAEYSNAVSQYLRFESGFSGRIRELAILVTAREMNSQFEWAAHEAEALKEGLPKEIVDVVKYRKSLEGVPETESAIIQGTASTLAAFDMQLDPGVQPPTP